MELVRKSNCFERTAEGRCGDHCQVDLLQGRGKQGTSLGTSHFWLRALPLLFLAPVFDRTPEIIQVIFALFLSLLTYIL